MDVGFGGDGDWGGEYWRVGDLRPRESRPREVRVVDFLGFRPRARRSSGWGLGGKREFVNEVWHVS